VLIMVRRNELACRDEWSRSLWQPRERNQSNGDMPFQRPTPGPLPPTLAENLRSVLNRDLAHAASSQGEDVLLSEARILSEEHEPWEPQQRSFPVGNFDPRTAIFRAREAYRERVRAKSAAERLSAGVEASMESPAAEEVVPASTDRPTIDPSDHAPHEAGAVADALPAPLDEADAWLSGATEFDSPVAEAEHSAVPDLSEEAARTGPPVLGQQPYLDEPLIERRSTLARSEQVGAPAGGSPVIEEEDSARRLVGLDERETLPDWYRTELPRICRTCRDYRPAADGQRGWCANTWAFTHRRLVLEDDPAPCQSAIGDWWLPVDDVWLVAADVSSHGRATPLLDRLTAKADQQRRRS
jgi:hypothetical protein